MVRRARALSTMLGAGAVAAALVACNAILDNHDRVLDERDTTDATGGKDVAEDTTDSGGDTGVGPIDSGADAPPDAGPIVVPVTIAPAGFKTPNGAGFGAGDGGTGITITAAAASATHPVIVPIAQPNIPSNDYTVEIVVRAPTKGEFGVLARVQPDGSAAILSSAYGGQFRGFLGAIPSTDWNPSLITQGATDVPFTANDRFHLVLRVAGAQAYGKFWNADREAEPANPTLLGAIPYGTGRGVGYYVYNTYDAILESMTVTVP